ncbi:MAG: chorismate mutase [Bacteroidota bacterium]
MSEKESISRIREEIDFMDDMIILLISKRQELVSEVGTWKKEHKKKVSNPAREKTIMNHILSLAPEANLDPAFLNQLYEVIFQHSRDLQKIV